MKSSTAKNIFVWAVTIGVFLFEAWFARYMLFPRDWRHAAAQ